MGVFTKLGRAGAVGLAAMLATGAAAAGAGGAQGASELDGRLIVAHGDDFTTSAMVMQVSLRTKTGDVPLRVSHRQHQQLIANQGRRVRVRGVREGGALTLETIAPIAAAPAAAAPATVVGTRRVALVLMHNNGSAAEPVSKQNANASFFGAQNSVADWFSEGSDGALTITGDVYGYYDSTLSANDCSISHWMTEAAQRAQADGYRAADYDHLVVYFPKRSCVFSGIAYVGASGVGLNGTLYPGVANHELGHNLGLYHSGALDCGSVAIAPSCTLSEYGDPFDVMGAAGYNRHYHGPHKRQLGWMPEAQVRTITGPGDVTVELTASERPIDGATELIVVPLAGGSTYAVERRASYGDYDQGLSGVWVRRLPPQNGVSQLLDMTPETASFGDGKLAAGMTFTDAARGVTFRTITDSGATASVQVCVGPCGAPPSGTVPHVEVQDRTIVVTGTDGADRITLTKVKKDLYAVDASGIAMISGPGCAAVGTTLQCAVKKLDRFVVNLADGNDQITVAGKVKTTIDGGPGADAFVGGKGADIFVGGAGADTVDYRGRTGQLTGTPGTGADDGTKREHDDIRGDVETVLLPTLGR